MRRVLSRVQRLLTAISSRPVRRGHCLGAFWDEIGPPVLVCVRVVSGSICEVGAHAVQRIAARCPLGAVVCFSIAAIAEPAKEWTEGNKASGCNAQAGLDIGPDGYVGGCVWKSLISMMNWAGRGIDLTEKVRVFVGVKIRNANYDCSACPKQS